MVLGLVKDIGDLVTARPSVRAAGYAATVNGASVDRLGSGGKMLALSGLLVADVGPTTGAPTSFTVDVKLQDSADDVSFADVTGETIPQITAVNTFKEKDVDLSGLRRYIRAVATIAFVGGTAPTIGVSCSFALGGFSELPPVAP